MIFDSLQVAEAEGAILVHSVRQGSLTFKKGRVLSSDDIAALKSAGMRTVVAARLEAGDVHEDEAARRLAHVVADASVMTGNAHTGRVNLFAESAGLAVIDTERLNRLNGIDESITMATVSPMQVVDANQMVATIKIIPFSAPSSALSLATAIGEQHGRGPILRVAKWQKRKVGLIQTRLPGTPEKVLNKTVQITADRLGAMSNTLMRERRCEHVTKTLAGEIRAMIQNGADIILMAGASAITDRRDVLPAALEAAGGEIDHFGMPVDPGNLLMLGHHGAVPILGLPGCARSPKLNGFDWVLQRLVAGLPVTKADITGMGAGGLLTDIPSRPLPRAKASAKPDRHQAGIGMPKIAALVLAAGQSRRMGARNKLLAKVDATPMVVSAVDAASASKASEVVVVTGHEAEDIEDVLRGRGVRFVHNPDFADGLSTSLQAGLSALGDDVDGFIVLLGDMPRISAATVDRLIDAFNPLKGRAIVVPTYQGKRGNPVLWGRQFLGEMRAIAGDVGARHLIGQHADVMAEIEIDDDSVLLDIDTAAALEAATAEGNNRS
ncbi:MAG: molybdopterin-binding/glycosyltransferase family 2 protein [Pseudomonadota bacterium]